VEEVKSEDEIRAFEEARVAQQNKLNELKDQYKDEQLQSVDIRLSYLMQQSEVFAHFLANDGAAAVSADTSKSSTSKKNNTKRKMLSEADEDKQLMQLATSKLQTTRLTQQPSLIQSGQMRSYQLEGLNWLIKLHDNNINGILADEMGLGKTLQTISLIAYLKESRNILGPHLIIVPKSTVSNWVRECNKWCPSLRVVKLLGSKVERAKVCKEQMKVGQFDVLISSYESCLREASSFFKIKWKYVIIDEAHRIKNENSSLSKMVRLVPTEFKLLITGTPLQNNLHELWALLNFLLPEVFGNAALFDSWFNTVDSVAKENVIKRLHAVLKPFMLRRVKADVEKDLPSKKETKLYIGLTEMQKEWYTKILAKDVSSLNALGGTDRVRLLNVLMQLRKVCNHPYLFDGAEPGPPYFDGPHLWNNAGKMILMDKLLPKLKAQGSRVLIFCQMTRMINILQDYFDLKKYKYCRIDGSTSGEDRDKAMDDFNRPNSDKFIFVLSTRAGGVGINLQTADTVIIYDSDWNPQVDLQAIDRAHRIGQTKEVRVFRFVTEGSVEEKVVERANRKLFLDAAVIQQGRIAEKNSNLSKGELMTMIHFGADEIMSSKSGTISDEDIDVLLAKGEQRTQASNALLSTEMQNNLSNFSLAFDDSSEFNLFTFEGEDYRGKKNSNNGFQFLALPQRERKKNYDVDEYYNNIVRPEKQVPKKRKAFFLDYQFFDRSRLEAISDIESQIYSQKQDQVTKIKDLIAKDSRARHRRNAKKLKSMNTTTMTTVENDGGVDSDGDDLKESNPNVSTVMDDKTEHLENAERLQAELGSEKFELPQVMRDEKSRLFEEGFFNWTKRDFKVFMDAVEKYGSSNLPMLHKEVSIATDKTEDYVARYSSAFFSRISELPDYVKLVEKVDKGNKRVLREVEVKRVLEAKFACSSPDDLKIAYGAYRSRVFSENHDKMLLHLIHKLGYGNWEQIRQAIKASPRFQFDWYFKARTSIELQRRAEVILNLIMKES